MARCLDANGEDASLLDKKQKDGRKKSTVQNELAEENQVEHTVEHSQENSLHTPT